jgi:hypothetical protein
MQKTELTLSRINKKQVFLSFLIAILCNSLLFISGYNKHQLLKEKGVRATLYIRPLTENETTFFDKLKYTAVANTFFINSKGDTIFEKCKNIWRHQFEFLEDSKMYLPFDQVIYDKNNAKNYQLINDFQHYSITYQAISYSLIGPLFLTVFIYFVINFFKIIQRKFVTQ